jgi:hypothetical protein
MWFVGKSEEQVGRLPECESCESIQRRTSTDGEESLTGKEGGDHRWNEEGDASVWERPRQLYLRQELLRQGHEDGKASGELSLVRISSQSHPPPPLDETFPCQ